MRGETSPIGGVRGSWAGLIKQNDRNAAEEDAAAIVAGEHSADCGFQPSAPALRLRQPRQLQRQR
jgi:hypothetical protein